MPNLETRTPKALSTVIRVLKKISGGEVEARQYGGGGEEGVVHRIVAHLDWWKLNASLLGGRFLPGHGVTTWLLPWYASSATK